MEDKAHTHVRIHGTHVIVCQIENAIQTLLCKVLFFEVLPPVTPHMQQIVEQSQVNYTCLRTHTHARTHTHTHVRTDRWTNTQARTNTSKVLPIQQNQALSPNLSDKISH